MRAAGGPGMETLRCSVLQNDVIRRNDITSQQMFAIKFEKMSTENFIDLNQPYKEI